MTESSRVCNTCWCKTLRTKHARCPLLSCSTSSKVKKLRHLPGKWVELSAHTRDILSSELRKLPTYLHFQRVFFLFQNKFYGYEGLRIQQIRIS